MRLPPHIQPGFRKSIDTTEKKKKKIVTDAVTYTWLTKLTYNSLGVPSNRYLRKSTATQYFELPNTNQLTSSSWRNLTCPTMVRELHFERTVSRVNAYNLYYWKITPRMFWPATSATPTYPELTPKARRPENRQTSASAFGCLLSQDLHKVSE